MTTPHQQPSEIWMEVLDPKKIAKLMVIQEVSARTLARQAGWRSHTYMQRILRGEVKTLEVEPAVRIARFLGVGVDDLFVPRVSSDTGQTAKRTRRAA